MLATHQVSQLVLKAVFRSSPVSSVALGKFHVNPAQCVSRSQRKRYIIEIVNINILKSKVFDSPGMMEWRPRPKPVCACRATHREVVVKWCNANILHLNFKSTVFAVASYALIVSIIKLYPSSADANRVRIIIFTQRAFFAVYMIVDHGTWRGSFRAHVPILMITCATGIGSRKNSPCSSGRTSPMWDKFPELCAHSSLYRRPEEPRNILVSVCCCSRVENAKLSS